VDAGWLHAARSGAGSANRGRRRRRGAGPRGDGWSPGGHAGTGARRRDGRAAKRGGVSSAAGGRCGNLFAFLEKRGGSRLSYRSAGGGYLVVVFQRRELRSKVFGGFIWIIYLII
jgi:hypothetical protein